MTIEASSAATREGTPVSSLIQSIDVLRGMVMNLMAINDWRVRSGLPPAVLGAQLRTIAAKELGASQARCSQSRTLGSYESRVPAELRLAQACHNSCSRLTP